MNLSHQQIAKLVRQVKAKDSQAFTTLYEHTYQRLYFLALSILKCEHEAQDAVQEAYIKILGAIEYLKEEQTFVAWSNRIVYNICIRMLAKKGRTTVTEDLNYLQAPEEDDPLSRAIQNDQQRMVVQAIESLEPDLRTTIILKYYQGLKIKEIALVMTCPEGTVKSRLNTARHQLRDIIEGKAKATGHSRIAMLVILFALFTLGPALQNISRVFMR